MLFMPIFSYAPSTIPSIWGGGFLDSIPQTTLESILVLCTVFAILFAIGVYLILYIRKSIKSNGKITNDELLLRFSKLYDSGEITKEEYRQIKLQFAQKLKEEQLQASKRKAADDLQGTRKSRKKKKKRHSDSQSLKTRFHDAGLDSFGSDSRGTSNSDLLRFLLENSDRSDFRSDESSNSSAHTRSDSAPIPRPDKIPPDQPPPRGE